MSEVRRPTAISCQHEMLARPGGEFSRLCRVRANICAGCCRFCVVAKACVYACPGPEFMDCAHMIMPEMGSVYRQTKCKVRKAGCVACCIACRLFFAVGSRNKAERHPGCHMATGCPRAAQVREARSC